MNFKALWDLAEEGCVNLLYCSYYWSYIIHAVLRGKLGEISKVSKQETHLQEPNLRAFSFSSFPFKRNLYIEVIILKFQLSVWKTTQQAEYVDKREINQNGIVQFELMENSLLHLGVVLSLVSLINIWEMHIIEK